jgi:hypothetical protein
LRLIRTFVRLELLHDFDSIGTRRCQTGSPNTCDPQCCIDFDHQIFELHEQQYLLFPINAPNEVDDSLDLVAMRMSVSIVSDNSRGGFQEVYPGRSVTIVIMTVFDFFWLLATRTAHYMPTAYVEKQVLGRGDLFMTEVTFYHCLGLCLALFDPVPDFAGVTNES